LADQPAPLPRTAAATAAHPSPPAAAASPEAPEEQTPLLLLLPLPPSCRLLLLQQQLQCAAACAAAAAPVGSACWYQLSLLILQPLQPPLQLRLAPLQSMLIAIHLLQHAAQQQCIRWPGRSARILRTAVPGA
jgi:hypothetical protein